jgi:Spy/CpxP family protein refolding chaperone
MSFKRKLIPAITLAFAFGTFTTFVSAQDGNTSNQQDSTKKERKFERRGDGLRGRHGDRMMMHGLRQLNLTDAQKEQIKTIHESRKPSQALHEEIRGLMLKRRDGSITEQEQNRLKEIRTQMRASAEQTHNAVLAVLTAEQRAQLEQLKQEKRERRGLHRGVKKEGQAPTTNDNN